MIDKTITSLHNQRVKDAIKLRDHRQRVKQGRFVIDGAREILRALHGQVPLDECFVCEAQCQSADSQQLLSRLRDTTATLWHVTPEVMAKLAFGERSEGVIAVAPTPRRTLADLSLADDALVAVIEGVEKPGNVGAILRSADAAGVSAVIAADPRVDLYNPNCIRASLGVVFTLPVCHATSAETLDWLQRRKARVFAARVDATLSYSSADYRGSAAIVLGSEAEGLSSVWRGEGIVPIQLPMRGTADSLNVSATAAVLFYEALRQRES